MNRRRFLLAATAFTLLSTTAARADYVEDIVKWLQKEGYSDIDVTRTLLGRMRIVALKDGQRRELVCNPRTGEILRDVWISADGDMRPPASSPGSNDEQDDDNDSGHGSGGDGGSDDDSSGHGGGSDDDGDDGGHDGGDDSSGHDGGDDDKSEDDDDKSKDDGGDD